MGLNKANSCTDERMCAHFVIAVSAALTKLEASINTSINTLADHRPSDTEIHPDYSPDANNHIVIALQIL